MPLQDVLERLRSYPDGGLEETAKIQVVLPILREVGWDDTDFNQVVFEHPVATRGGGRVDIALRAPRGNNVALVEVKAPGKQLDEFVAQVLEYAFHDGVDMCALTTGLIWWLYLPREKGQPAERRFAVLDLQRDPIAELDDGFETYLHRDALLDGTAERRAKQALEALLNQERLATEIPRVWQQMLSEPDHQLVELIEQRVFRSVRLRPSAEQIADVLRESSKRGGPVPRKGHSPETAAMATPRRAPTGGKQPATTVTGFFLWGEMYTVQRQYQVLTGVVEIIHQRYAGTFDRALRVRAIHTGSPRNQSSDQIGDSGYYVDRGMNYQSMVKTCHRLLEAFEHNADELTIIEDNAVPRSHA